MLFANVQTLDDVQISLWIDPFEVIQQATPTTHHHQKTTPAGIVFLVRSHVVREAVNPGGKDSNLNLGGACVALIPLVILD